MGVSQAVGVGWSFSLFCRFSATEGWCDVSIPAGDRMRTFSQNFYKFPYKDGELHADIQYR